MTEFIDVRPRRTERRWTVGLALGFVAVALLLHLPGLTRPLFNSDEASLATMAMVIERGGTLYHETADRKPPLVPYIYALVFQVTGERDIRPVRAVGALVLAATALLIALEVLRRRQSRAAATTAGLLFLAATAATFPADAQAAGFELFMLLPMTAAFVAAARQKAVVAGLCLAVACLCKQTAMVTALPAAILLLRGSGWRAVVRAALAGTAVILATALMFGPREFILWTVTGNGGYLSLRGSVLASSLRGIGMTSAFLIFNAGLVWCCVRARRTGDVDGELWWWLAGSGLAVLAGFRFFGHYYLQLVPPLVLIAAAGLPSRRILRTRAAAAVALPVVAMWLFSFFPPNARGIIPYDDVADRVRSVTEPGDRIFVWGEYPEIYWAANREPATRFIHTGFLTGNSGGRDARLVRPSDGMPGAWDLLAADISAAPPDLIVDTSRAFIRKSEYHPLDQTFLWDIVLSDYHLTDVVDGVRLYERK